jgi:hypothetical protein
MVYDAEWGDEIAGDGLPFSNADLEEGDGWWVDLELRRILWRQDAWRLDASASGSYRRETYELTYDALQQTGTIVVEAATNGTPSTIVPVWGLVPASDEAAFTESTLKIGLRPVTGDARLVMLRGCGYRGDR